MFAWPLCRIGLSGLLGRAGETIKDPAAIGPVWTCKSRDELENLGGRQGGHDSVEGDDGGVRQSGIAGIAA
jgi:hypothetical protein